MKYLLAFLTGAGYVLAFAPVKLWWLAFLVLAALFQLWLSCKRPKQAFWTGYAFGLGMFGAGVSWMYVSLSTFGNMAPSLSVLAVLLLILALSLFPALVGLLQSYFASQSVLVRVCSVMVPLWLLAEWLREWMFSGLPWLAAGYTQTDNMLSAWAPLGGVYLVSLVVLLLAAALTLLLKRSYLVACLTVLFIAVTTFLVQSPVWTQAQPQQLSVKLVQGNVSIWDKWNPAKTGQILDHYLSLSKQAGAADLVIWPEAAAPLLLSRLPDRFWQRLVETNNRSAMFGIVERDSQSGQSYNTVVAFNEKQQLSAYRKVQLVPFGEFLPLKFMLTWLLDYLNIPMSDFSAFSGQQDAIEVNGVKIGVSICYEDAFANVIRSALPQADVLVNVSEDAWFGDSLAPHQRLQMAQMRAIENGRNLVRVSNNGLSAIIDYQGKIQQIAPQFVSKVIAGHVQARSGATPFSIWGHKLVLALTSGLFLIGCLSLLLGYKKTATIFSSSKYL